VAERFFAPELTEGVSSVELDADETRHLRSVCRARVGDEIILFDGAGLRATARISALEKRYTLCEPISFSKLSTNESNPFTLAVAMPKGDRAVTLIEKATELGVGRVIPLVSERSMPAPRDEKQERFRRVVIAACKQCGRDSLMRVDEPSQFGDVVQGANHGTRWILHPYKATSISHASPAPHLVLVGPEGGFSDAEVELALAHGFEAVSLPGHILRVETAALAIAAWRICQPSPQPLQS
jgi:16S rRNA (uracil1498-N3)-methyltransferase